MKHILVISIILIILTGCTTQYNEDSMPDGSSSNTGYLEETNSTIDTSKSVKLTCLHNREDKPYEDFVSQELEIVEAFEAVIKNAELMPGILNYVAEYTLQISSSKQLMKTYHLSLGADRTMKGLLVDTLDTNKGYEIPIDDANKLRDIILR